MFLNGTLLNAAAVVVGTTAGLLLGGRLSDRLRESLTIGIGLFTLAIGASMVLPVFGAGAAVGDSLVVLSSLLVGVALGEAMRLQDALEALGRWFERRLSRGGERPSRIAEAFVTASLVFCVGPLTILGSLDNGLRGDATLLATKSILDGVTSIAFAAALGPGVYLAALTILVFQSSLAGAAFLTRDVLDERTILVTTAVGGTILLGMALRLLELRRVRVANFLPGLVLAPIAVRLADLVRGALG